MLQIILVLHERQYSFIRIYAYNDSRPTEG